MAKKTAPARRTPARDENKPAEVLPIEAVSAASTEQQQSVKVGAMITHWLAQLGPFFSRAKDLEESAKGRLEQSKALQPPKSAEEDEAIQIFVKRSREEQKEIEDHWSITSTIHGLHRVLTARRGVGVRYLEDAQENAQRLHNRYKEEQERIAREEQDRLRREAEQKAREERERELREAEERALQLEADSPELSEREAQFVDFYTLEIYRGTSQGNASAAARRAGYKNPDQIAPRLIASDKIRAAIEAKQQAEAIRKQAAARKAEPIHADVPNVRPNVSRAAGSYDRVSHSAELLDERALIDAILRGGYGIPTDVLTVNPAKLNEYARSLQERINAWPGVRYKRNNTTV